MSVSASELEVTVEKPLNTSQKAVLSITAFAMIGLCYAFSIVSILLLLFVIAFELIWFLGAARFGLSGHVTPILRRHASILMVFVRSFWLGKHHEMRIQLQPHEAPKLFTILEDLSR